jgi:hypothetical protein
MTTMRIIQFRYGDAVRTGMVREDQIVLCDGGTIYDHAMAAIAAGIGLVQQIEASASDTLPDYEEIAAAGDLLPPIAHPDPAHLLVSGTGLTHLGSAEGRAQMHAGLTEDAATTDSMRMFHLGLEGGRPEPDAVGALPEWFYKGDGSILVAPGAAIPMPDFALDAGEEPELAGIYVIDPSGVPRRLGFAVGNEFSDHVTERGNYLWLAHSKLRFCSIGPELVVGDVESDLRGVSRIWRDDAVLWEKPFLTGEANMSHSLANLEHHHFKYSQFRRPGDVHVHFFGTATLSFSDGVRTQAGDTFEIALDGFGRSLVNGFEAVATDAPTHVVRL